MVEMKRLKGILEPEEVVYPNDFQSYEWSAKKFMAKNLELFPIPDIPFWKNYKPRRSIVAITGTVVSSEFLTHLKGTNSRTFLPNSTLAINQCRFGNAPILHSNIADGEK